MKRKEFYERGEMTVREVENKRILGRSVEKRIMKRQRQVQEQELRENKKKSRYNNMYDRIQVPWLETRKKKPVLEESRSVNCTTVEKKCYFKILVSLKHTKKLG